MAKKRKAAEKPAPAGPDAATIASNKEKVKKRMSRVVIERDEEGNIQYPIVINPSLSIMNLGRIEHEKPGYHTEK